MQLIKSLTKINKNKVTEIIYQCMEHLSSLSPDFSLTADDFEFGGLFEATGLQGQTGLGQTGGKFKQVISFNANMFREGLEDIYLNTIYHEFLHVIVNKYMISNNIIALDENGQLKINNREFFKAVEDNKGHGGLWLEYAVRANKALNLTIPITPYCSDESMQKVLDSSLDDYEEPAIEIVCQDCGAGNKFLTVNVEELPSGFGLLAMYYDTVHKNINHFCKKCNGTMYIIIRDAEFKAFMDRMLDDHAMELLFYKMTSQFA